MTTLSASTGGSRALRAQALFNADLSGIHRSSDRVFAGLMAVQWVFAVLIAVFYSPYAWIGVSKSTHIHVYYAVFVGGTISGVSIALALKRPGWVGTRYSMVIAQVLWSALLIHLMGGRIEAHFHVFGSLAFVAFYRDWRLVLAATVVVTLDHLLRGFFWPQSVFGIVNAEWWRPFEHAAWVVFEDTVLLMGIFQTRREMKILASRQADLESLNESIETAVISRTEDLATSREQFRALVESTRSVPWQWDLRASRFVYVGPQAGNLLSCATADWLLPGFFEAHLHAEDRDSVLSRWHEDEGSDFELEFRLCNNEGQPVSVRCVIGSATTDGSLRGFMQDVTEQRRLEFELQQAQKLESVGRLAAGIAHEINTPIQFVNDSIQFVRDAFDDTLPLLGRYKDMRLAAVIGAVDADLLASLERAEADADLEYIVENVPKALARSVEGLARVATLVRAMKEFAHPDCKEKALADLNHAIETTLIIARNEYKYVAEIETDLTPLPPVSCHVNELNQAFLNIIVNAAHAVADVVAGSDRKGLIRIVTRADGDFVVVSIEDTGGGIPEHIRSKIFEPFFTTKEIGKGTGQGLAIARSVVVDKHGGSILIDSVRDVGTKFIIRLPVAASETNVLSEAA
jgi:signal transduction histidine kinase